MVPQKRPKSGAGSRSHPHQEIPDSSSKSLSTTSSSPSNKPKRKYRTCCGGKHIPEEERDAILAGGENVRSFPGQDHVEDEHHHDDTHSLLPQPVPDGVSSPRQDGGLFQMLLEDGGQQDNGGGQQQFSGVESTYDENLQDEEIPPTPTNDTDNSTQKSPRRRSKRPKICEDPFIKLPLIYPNPPTLINQDNKEQRKAFHHQQRVVRKGASGKFAKPLYPDEPFKQLAHVVFTSADVDKDSRLNRREFASILNSPSLELDLLKDDIKTLEMECAKDREDVKKAPISFDEFLPLAECLLALYYSKRDTISKNQWCVLDRDKKGHLYFNKHTGETSFDRPLDFYEEKESHLLEEALTEIFETADMDKDGQIRLYDFFMIINSADFGLILTKRDIKELTKQFLNEAGKVSKVAYSEFIGLARRLIVTVYRARDSTPFEWCHLYTRQVGSFWFNKRTGQTQRYAPNFYVRMQQTHLTYRENEMKVFAENFDELKETKAALEQEMALREDFEQKFHDLTDRHDKLSKTHESTVAILDKTKLEYDKTLKKNNLFDKENTKLQAKLKYVESRVAEMERTEANLESLRDVLRNSQTSVKERDYEITELKEKLSVTKKDLKDEQNKCEEMSYKIVDLHKQLRDELKRNEKMEKELDKVPVIKKEMDAVNTKMQKTENAMEEKKAHIILARATHRDDKDKITSMEKELSRLPQLEEDLELANSEVYTLKQLLIGKDRLVMKKSQELENAKERWEDEDDPGGGGRRVARGSVARGNYANNVGGVKVMRMDSSSPSLTRHSSRQDFWATSSSSNSSGPPSTISNSSQRHEHKGSHRRSRSTRLDISTPPNGTISERPKSAPPEKNSSTQSPPGLCSMSTKNGGFLKLLYNNGTAQDMPTVYDLYTPDGSYAPVGDKPLTPSLKNGSLHSSSLSDRLDESNSSSRMQAGSLMFEDDFMAAQFIRFGDRVRLRKPGARPGSCKTNDILTGIVKFVGKIDKEKTDHRLYVGLKLDDALGDTDGVIKGKRYFNVNMRHGKLVRINTILSVLNPKTGSYKRVSESIREQRLTTGTVRLDRDRNPQLIRVI